MHQLGHVCIQNRLTDTVIAVLHACIFYLLHATYNACDHNGERLKEIQHVSQ